MVLHPETGSDLPIGSDRELGRDIRNIKCSVNVMFQREMVLRISF